MENLTTNFDYLPIELLYEIAGESEQAYKALLAYPRFARHITPGHRIDFMVNFGHDAKVVIEDYVDNQTPVYGIIWYRNNVPHRMFEHAVENTHGDKEWWYNGMRHREDGPAVINRYGAEFWYRNGVLHREDGPAVKYSDGVEIWYRNGMLHRDDGPAVVNSNGDQYWYRDGEYHVTP